MSNYVMTTEMELEEWLAARKNFVGASESSALLGLNPYKTAVELYAEKIGLKDADEDNFAMRYGRDMEPVIRKWFESDTGLQVREDHKIRIHPKITFMACNLDGMGISFNDLGPFAHEIKTTTEMTWEKEQGKTESEEPVPYLYHYIQMQHQLSVTGWNHGYISYEISGFGKRLEHIYIKRNEKVIERIEEAIQEFWRNHVQKLKSPDPVKKSDAQLLYPYAEEGEQIEANESVIGWLKQLRRFKEQKDLIKEDLKDLEASEEKIQAKIMGYMGRAESLMYNGEKLISNKTTNRKGYEVKPTSYRNFRPNYNKMEQAL